MSYEYNGEKINRKINSVVQPEEMSGTLIFERKVLLTLEGKSLDPNKIRNAKLYYYKDYGNITPFL